VTLGTGFLELEKLNGRPYVMEAWGSDFGGNITSWQAGNLARKFGDNGDYLLLLNFDWQFSLREPTLQQKRNLDELNRLKRIPLSSDSALRKLKPKIARMVFMFPREGR
jgi:hypothetical protein